MTPEMNLDPRNDLYSKEQVINRIKQASLTHFECNSRFVDGFPCEKEVISDLFSNTYTVNRTVAAYTADFAKESEDMIYRAILEIIRNENITDLYVLNRQQIIEALTEYAEKNNINKRRIPNENKSEKTKS